MNTLGRVFLILHTVLTITSYIHTAQKKVELPIKKIRKPMVIPSPAATSNAHVAAEADQKKAASTVFTFKPHAPIDSARTLAEQLNHISNNRPELKLFIARCTTAYDKACRNGAYTEARSIAMIKEKARNRSSQSAISPTAISPTDRAGAAAFSAYHAQRPPLITPRSKAHLQVEAVRARVLTQPLSPGVITHRYAPAAAAPVSHQSHQSVASTATPRRSTYRPKPPTPVRTQRGRRFSFKAATQRTSPLSTKTQFPALQQPSKPTNNSTITTTTTT